MTFSPVAEIYVHRPLAALVPDAESTEIGYLFVCREMTANKKFAAFGKKDDHLFTPEGMSGFARSTPALWNVYRIKSLSLGMYGVLN